MWIRNEITHHVRFWYCSDVALIEGGGEGGEEGYATTFLSLLLCHLTLWRISGFFDDGQFLNGKHWRYDSRREGSDGVVEREKG